MKTLVVLCLAMLLISAKQEKIELEKRQCLNNKIEILIPKGFEIMSEEMLNVKYPSNNRPTLVYTNERGTINVAFNHTASSVTQNDIEAVKDYLLTTLKKVHPSAEWKSTGVSTINERKVGFLEFVTPAIDTKIYNLMFFTELDGRLLICSFNCTVENQEDWTSPAKQIMSSLKVK